MADILRFKEHVKKSEMVENFFENLFDISLNESNKQYDESLVKKILKDLSNDIKFNTGLVFTFGTGIALMLPVVNNLIENSKINFETSTENLVLLTLTIVAIAYLEESGNKQGDNVIECVLCNGSGKEEICDDDVCELVKCESCEGTGKVKSMVSKKEVQSMLEELRMRGIGDAIVKKFVESFKAIGRFSAKMLANTPYAVSGLLEMFAYTSLLIPIMNAIQYFIGNYEITLDNLKGNILSLGVMVGSFLAKRGVNWLIKKFKELFNLKDIPDVKTDYMHKITSDIGDRHRDSDMIKEQ